MRKALKLRRRCSGVRSRARVLGSVGALMLTSTRTLGAKVWPVVKQGLIRSCGLAVGLDVRQLRADARVRHQRMLLPHQQPAPRARKGRMGPQPRCTMGPQVKIDDARREACRATCLCSHFALDASRSWQHGAHVCRRPFPFGTIIARCPAESGRSSAQPERGKRGRRPGKFHTPARCPQGARASHAAPQRVLLAPPALCAPTPLSW